MTRPSISRGDPVGRARNATTAEVTSQPAADVEQPGSGARVDVLTALQATTLLAMAGTVATRLWQDHVWLGWLIAATAAGVWAPALHRPAIRRWWFVYVGGTFIYTLLRSYADETAIPVRFDYAIEVDRALLLGADPVRWLQGPLFHPGSVSALDVGATFVHWSFFVVPHAAAVAVFVWRRELFPRYIAAMVASLYVGLLLFFLLPTAPPWLASQAGELTGVFRVMDYVGNSVAQDTYSAAYSSLGEPNSVAAMPSIHMAVTFVLCLWAFEHCRRAAGWLLVYTGLMALSLIYLGEHYAADVLGGLAVAVVCYLAARQFVPVGGDQAARL